MQYIVRLKPLKQSFLFSSISHNYLMLDFVPLSQATLLQH